MNDTWKLLAAAVVILLSITTLVSSFDYSGDALDFGGSLALFVTENRTVNGTFSGSGNNNGVAGQGGSLNGDTPGGNSNVDRSGVVGATSGDIFDNSLLRFFADVIGYIASSVSGFAPWLSSPLDGVSSWLSPPPAAPANVVPAATVPGIVSPGVAAPSDDNMGIIILAILMLVVFAAIGIILVKKYRISHLQKPGEIDAVSQPVEEILGSFEGAYKLRFPDIGDPFPLLWGAGEPLAIAISKKAGASGEVSIAVDGKEQKKLMLDSDIVRTTIIIEKGKHRISISSAGMETSWADIRIVDYREEVVSLFNMMFRSFKIDRRAMEEMTPRELEQAVVEGMPETKRIMLDDAVSVFEIANYSIHDIRRHEYERMYLSKVNVI